MALSRQKHKGGRDDLPVMSDVLSDGHVSVLLGLPPWTVYPVGSELLFAAFLVRGDPGPFRVDAGAEHFAAVLIISVAARIGWSRTLPSGQVPSLSQLDEDAEVKSSLGSMSVSGLYGRTNP